MEKVERVNQDLLKILDVADGCCCYCGRRLNGVRNHRFSATVDHIIPRCNGGSNHSSNRIPCCKSCNEIKGDYSLNGFLIKVEQYLHMNIGGSKNTLQRWRHLHKNIVQIILIIDQFKHEMFVRKRA